MDGPFGESRHLVAGFWLWDVKDIDEAVAWVKCYPNPVPGPSEIEIRPLHEMNDLRLEPSAGDLLTNLGSSQPISPFAGPLSASLSLLNKCLEWRAAFYVMTKAGPAGSCGPTHRTNPAC